MSKSYTLLLNSANAINRSGAGTTSYSYYVNWQSVLPSSCKKFDVSFSLKSQMVASPPVVGEVVLLSCNIGNQTTFDQSYSQTPIVCALTPKSNAGSTIYFYYESMVTDESGFMVGYPQNSNLEIKLLNVNPSASGVYSLAGTFPHYILQLTFTEIEEDE